MKFIDSILFKYKDNNWAIYEARRNDLYTGHFDNLDKHIGVLSEDEAEAIVNYMEIFQEKEGHWMSYPPDPLNETVVVEHNGGADGTYAWSGLMFYLIKTYKVDPPLAFRKHVTKRLSSGTDLIAERDHFFDANNSEGYWKAMDLLRGIDDVDVKKKFVLYP